MPTFLRHVAHRFFAGIGCFVDAKDGSAPSEDATVTIVLGFFSGGAVEAARAMATLSAAVVAEAATSFSL
jgi:hypothetical protein